MRFGSVCSGIEAASVAWHPLGWQAAWLAEIEPFPSAVLKHHYPEVPNYGDMTKLPERILSGDIEAPDLFCGGTPCQAFSVAGLRKSLDDARGNLSLTFCEIANAIDTARLAAGQQPCIVLWENVPGVLSTKDNAFGCFLGALAGCDSAIVPNGRWTSAGVVDGPQRTVAWRVLDAQYFGLAQRRKRVFVVASAREGFDPVEVLLEFDGVRRDTAPSREAGEVAAPCVTAGAANGGAAHGARSGSAKDNLIVPQPYSVANCLTQRMHKGINTTLDEGQTPVLAHSLRGEGFDASEDGTGRGTPLVPVAQPVTYDFFNITAPVNRQNRQPGDPCHTLARSNAEHAVLAFHPTQDPISSTEVCHAIGTGSGQGCATAAVAFDTYNQTVTGDTAQTLCSRGDTPGGNAHLVPAVQQAMQVRRLTPVECERLQGFPDNYTRIPWKLGYWPADKHSPEVRAAVAELCPDGPRYKALGNSWAVPCVRWIGERILRAANDNLPTTKATHVI